MIFDYVSIITACTGIVKDYFGFFNENDSHFHSEAGTVIYLLSS